MSALRQHSRTPTIKQNRCQLKKPSSLPISSRFAPDFIAYLLGNGLSDRYHRKFQTRLTALAASLPAKPCPLVCRCGSALPPHCCRLAADCSHPCQALAAALSTRRRRPDAGTPVFAGPDRAMSVAARACPTIPWPDIRLRDEPALGPPAGLGIFPAFSRARLIDK